jgi:hypothetical protein
MEARVTADSQVDRLKERMEQAKVRHGQEIRADLPGIRVSASARKSTSPRRTPWPQGRGATARSSG